MSRFLKKIVPAALVALGIGIASHALSDTRPSTNFQSYVLFATEQIRTRGVTIADGNVGVNAGDILIRRDFVAPRSQVAARTITLLPPFGDCRPAQLFAQSGTSTCGTLTPFTPPVLGPGVFDLAEACGFPGRPIECDQNAAAVIVNEGETRTLGPGTYGELLMRGAGTATATAIFTGGEYTFCRIRATRDSRMLFTDAATVFVASDVRIGDRNLVGPAPGSTLAASAIRFLVNGSQIGLRPRAQAHALFCAPVGNIHLGARVVVEGQLVARSIRLDGDIVTGLSGSFGGSTTTVPTSSSTTTTRAGCGNGRREGTEVCDAPDFGSATCPGSSVAGAFLQCVDSCSRIDFNGCPGAPTTTSTSTTIATTTTSSTAPPTTIPPARCGDAIKNGIEACDPPDFGGTTCPGSTESPGCSADCTELDFSACPPTDSEICGNCVDDDGNGLTDFEDPACCATARTFRMTLSKGRIIPGAGSSKLRLRAILARAGLARVDPRVQDVFLQLKTQLGGDLLCAQIPAARFVAKGRAFRFVDNLATVPSARGVTALVVRIQANGSVRFKARGKQVQVGEAQAGTMQVTVGFRSPGTTGGETRCSTTTQAFRSSPKGGLLTP